MLCPGAGLAPAAGLGQDGPLVADVAVYRPQPVESGRGPRFFKAIGSTAERAAVLGVLCVRGRLRA
jgi:hypothetical protein